MRFMSIRFFTKNDSETVWIERDVAVLLEKLVNKMEYKKWLDFFFKWFSILVLQKVSSYSTYSTDHLNHSIF